MPVAEQPALSFAGLLRRLRDDAGLTQEELAEAASLSPRSVSDLERGVNRTARHETARLLAGALGLTGPQRALFEAAARGRAPASQVLAAGEGAAAATRTPPRDIASFTGRVAEPAQGCSAAATVAGGVHGFPVTLTSFVGRDGPVREVAGLLADYRLVTVTGPGGSGKTRLAGEVARRVAGRFADGTWLVELAPVIDPEQVPAVVAAALGVRDVPGVRAGEAVARVLARQQLLLVLDNCEHLIGAAAELCADLLLACDDVRLLTTSREPLAVSGEAPAPPTRRRARPGGPGAPPRPPARAAHRSAATHPRRGPGPPPAPHGYTARRSSRPRPPAWLPGACPPRPATPAGPLSPVSPEPPGTPFPAVSSSPK